MSTLSTAKNDILAGTISGMVTQVVVHPLDTIRVRLQTAPPGRFTGVFDVCRQTVKNEGALAFYKGMAMPLLAQGVFKACMFLSFGQARLWAVEHNKKQTGAAGGLLPIHLVFACGSFSGICNSFVANPFELVRNRLQVQYHAAKDKASALYKGPIDCVVQLVKSNGIRSLWVGVLPMIYRDAPGLGAWYAVNESVRRVLAPGLTPAETPKWKLLLAGACGGIGFWTFAFPQDLIKNVIQTQGMYSQVNSQDQSSFKRLGFFETGAKLVREEGIGRLFRGFSIAVTRGIPGAAVTFTTYQTVINFLNEKK